jgi:putative NIF3 family GTP cyclohydrolase 1 type 2
MRVSLTVLICLIVLYVPLVLRAQTPTAAEAFGRIQRSYQTEQPADTVDTLKAGDPTTRVTGIATTFLATMDVLRQAARRGDNLVISHEPTFYNHKDDTSKFQDDPVYREKLAYIEEHHLVVYRMHDAIHDARTDHILDGLYEALGWSNYQHPPSDDGQYVVTIPKTTLLALAELLRGKLNVRTLRVEGDPNLVVTHAAVLPGSAGLQEQMRALQRPEVDVLIAGEAQEWETVEYVRDAVDQKRPKALILLGHEVSEEPGMEKCAKDLRMLFPGLRVDHFPAGQPLSSTDDLKKATR